jgi:hypothetical protein
VFNHNAKWCHCKLQLLVWRHDLEVGALKVMVAGIVE